MDNRHELHIGMRNIKTAIAVFISMLVFEGFKLAYSALPESGGAWLGFVSFVLNRGDPTFACVASVVVMQSTVEGSVKLGKSRIWGTTFGGIFGITLLWLDNHFFNRSFSLLFIFIGIVFLIAFCNYFNRKLSVSIAIITLLIIMISNNNSSPYIYAFNRMFDTSIGVVVSLCVNSFVMNPARRAEKEKRLGKKEENDEQ